MILSATNIAIEMSHPLRKSSSTETDQNNSPVIALASCGIPQAHGSCSTSQPHPPGSPGQQTEPGSLIIEDLGPHILCPLCLLYAGPSCLQLTCCGSDDRAARGLDSSSWCSH